MKIVKNNILPKIPKKSYPYFGQDEDGTVILFNKPKCGMCVNVGDTDEDSVLFEYDVVWAEELFTRIPNYSITITTDK